MTQLNLHTGGKSGLNPGRAAPQIHKWFARRRPEAVQQVLEGLDETGARQNLRVMDPFAGSGMILLEALVRGHDVFGVDINPVAWLTASQTLNPPDVERVRSTVLKIDEAVGQKIRAMFKTATPEGTPADVVTAFYTRVTRTAEGHDLELHHNYLLARNKKRNWAVYYCPMCGAVFHGPSDDVTSCSECRAKFNWTEGTVRRGRAKVGNEDVRLTELYDRESDGPRFKLIAIESYSAESGRRYHRPSVQDFVTIETAELECSTNDIAKTLRSTLIPANRRDPRPISHGFTSYGQLYTPRQLLSLSLIADAIKSIEDESVRYTLALALSDTAGNNNRMCRYAADWLKLTPAFGLHGFDVVTRPVEGNTWGAGRGRGSFTNCVTKAIRAYSTIACTIDDLESNRKSRIIRDMRCMPAQKLSDLPWEPMDAIVTDPPYFDNLDYAELGDFFYQWLRIVLDGIYPFNEKYSFNPSDLSRIAALDGSSPRFGNELSEAMIQAVAHLKPEGVVAFSYHHAKPRAWMAVAEALRVASIVPYKLRFVRSELENGFHSSTGNIKIDSIFYCRRRMELESVNSQQVLEDALNSLSALDELKPIDVVSANYAMTTALAALRPRDDFGDLLEFVRRFNGQN